MNDQDRRSMPLFAIGIVKKLTELTARQIRYYEDHDLIQPERTTGNQRLFSFNDVDRLLEIKNYLDKGVNLAGVKLLLDPSMKKAEEAEEKATEITERELRHMLKHELYEAGRFGKSSLRQGELSRFFH
ncbi:MerR family transcriptional regulator [Virgibacillus phasianinus]|uniref:MerR family transcriptional regulator n=1 Tax=Virgibacillus phasianinus TaxID=2017483 RepID=A0A220U5P9_9BACI|nr:MerR family transcriptional regulator [Virgibacillus phasianinus]ASK63447.1 MerR family transcriptional regulator [Virgibacillus phasianinus]